MSDTAGTVDLSVCQVGDVCELRNGLTAFFSGSSPRAAGSAPGSHPFAAACSDGVLRTYRQTGQYTSYDDDRTLLWDIVRVTRNGVQVTPAEPSRNVQPEPEQPAAPEPVVREPAEPYMDVDEVQRLLMAHIYVGNASPAFINWCQSCMLVAYEYGRVDEDVLEEIERIETAYKARKKLAQVNAGKDG